jgi:hypothetical protein
VKKVKKSVALEEDTLQEIKNYAKLIAGYVATRQIERLVHTDERKAIWFLCSGKLSREGVALESGVSLRTVTTFIDMAKACGLLKEEKGKGGHPKRVIDYCPPEWKEYIKKKVPKEISSIDTPNPIGT